MRNRWLLLAPFVLLLAVAGACGDGGNSIEKDATPVLPVETVPVFNEELRVHKPVLVYWLIMSAYEMFGVSELAARFWSALLGIGTALLTYHLDGFSTRRRWAFGLR